VSEALQRKVVAKAAAPAAPWRAASQEAARADEEALFDLIELFFFAYRDFVGDADRLLENYGFGRAHHRVLHFVSRRPGLAIAAMLDILKITKQSLNRVLKQLLAGGFVEARAGANDRRQRLLYPTPKGARLAHDLARLQSERFARVLGELSPETQTAATDFLLAMIDADDRERVRAHLSRAPVRASPRKLAGGAA
jgi:DNA-binding MarR family transcriptional regulator